MSIYVRELLSDLQSGNLDIDTKVDLLSGIEYLYNTSQICYTDVAILNRYLEGYSLEEVAVWLSAGGCSSAADSRYIAETLIAMLSLLEKHTQYTDSIIVQHGLQLFPKHRKYRDRFVKECERLSKEL